MSDSKWMYFPISTYSRTGEWEELEDGLYKIAPILNPPSIFDLSTLSNRHDIRMPYQLMDFQLSQCQLEIGVNAPSLEDAETRLEYLLLGLYVESYRPCFCPLWSSRSINDYAEINTESQSKKEAVAQADRILNAEIHAMFEHLVLSVGIDEGRNKIDENSFYDAVASASAWQDIEENLESSDKKKERLELVRSALIIAPQINSYALSLLQIWAALEAMFPTIDRELSYRLALMLAQLIGGGMKQQLYERIKNAYDWRSTVAHGALSKKIKGKGKIRVGPPQINDAWNILLLAIRAIINRGRLPTEPELTKELLAEN